METANDNDRIEERRRTTRRRVLLKGKLASKDVALSWDCEIRSLSASGAQVRRPGHEILPSPLFLINARDGLAHEARVAWASVDHIGLCFVRSHDPAPADCRLSHLRRLWRASSPRFCGELA